MKQTLSTKRTLRQVATTLALAALVLFAPTAWGQTTVTIGDGTSTSRQTPINNYYNYSINEMLYTAEEIGMAGTISSISFYYSGPAKDFPITVYMKNVEATNLATGISLASAEQVFTGTYSVTATAGWHTITLGTPFSYDGESSLLIGIVKDYLYYYSQTPWYCTSTSSTMARYSADDNNAFTTSTVPGSALSVRPNIQISITPSAPSSCARPETLVASGVTAAQATFTWTGGSGTYNVEYKAASDADWTVYATNTSLTTATITGLAPTTDYSVRVQSVCTNEESSWKAANFTTPCAAYSIPYTYGFEEAAPFDCWSVLSGNVALRANYPNTGTYCLDFRGSTSNMIALPQFSSATNTLRVQFYTRPETTGGNSGKFAIGYMTDVTDASTFVAVATYNSTEMNPSYIQKTVDLVGAPANARIAFRQFDCSTYYYWFVDDVTVMAMPSCVAPVALAANNITTTSADLSWTSGGSETSWNLYYKSGADADYTRIANVTNPYTLSGLSASSTYQYYVVANCSATDSSEPSEVYTFYTTCAAVTTFPWSENFDSYATGDFSHPCWVNEHITGTGDQIFKIATYSLGDNGSTQVLQLPDMSSGTQTKLRLPEMTLPTTSDWLFSIDVYRNTDNSSYAQEGVRVFASTDGEIEGATELGFISRKWNETDGGVVTAESTIDWYTYEFPIPFTGTCYIILRGESRYGSSTYMDNFVVTVAPACPKPTAFSHTNVTAHTVDLSWTSDAAAFAVAYKDNDASDWTEVVANTNPFTLTGLNAETTYQVKVRANCGDDGYSDYCAARTFTTDIACPAPTGLTGTTTPHTVALSWTETGTATAWTVAYKDNDATEFTEVNVTSNPDTLTGLNAETAYTVKVRANCGGDDGYSAWTAEQTFTTLPACPAPILAASGITDIAAHNATVAWTGYEENNSYIVSYRTAAYFDGINEDFGTSGLPSDWTMYSGQFDEATGTATLASNAYWTSGTGNGYTSNHARLNIYGTNRFGWLVTPSINVGANFVLDFELGLTVWSSSSSASPTPGNQPDDKFIVLISTDNMTTWTVLRKWDNAGSAYVYDNIPNTGTPVSIDLSSYAGEDVYIAFYGESTVENGDNNVHIDNMQIGLPVPAGAWTDVANATSPTTLTGLVGETLYDVKVTGLCSDNEENVSNTLQFTTDVACPAPTGLQAVAYPYSATISWTSSASAYDVAYKLTTEEWENATIINNVASTSYTITGLTPETAYSVRVKAICGGDDGESVWSSQIDFITLDACLVPSDLLNSNVTPNQATLSWTGVQENYNVRYRTAGRYDSELFQGFEAGMGGWSFTSMNDTNDIGSHGSYPAGILGDQANTDSYSFRFSSYSKDNDGNYDQYLVSPELNAPASLSFYAWRYGTGDYLYVGTSTTTDDIDSFTWSNALAFNASQSWQQFTIALSSDVKYVAFHYYGNYAYYVYLDDITIIGGEYHEASAWVEATADTTTLDVAALYPETKYEWQVQGVDCDGNGTNTEWSAKSTFTTLPVTLNVEANKWYAISSPMHDNGQTYESLTNINGLVGTDFDYDLFRYDEANTTWESQQNTEHSDFDVFDRARGYIYRRSNAATLTFAGEPNTGNVSIDLTAYGSGDLEGFNLVGNPYCHTYTMNERCYSLTTDGSWEVHDGSYDLAIAEAVMVKTDAARTLTFSENTTPGDPSEAPALAFTVTGNGLKDVAYANMAAGDGMAKLSHFNEAAPVLSIPMEGRRYAIADLGDNCESFDMAFRGIAGEYTLTLTAERTTLTYCHLIDRATGKDIDLLANNTYTFTHTGNQAISDRFMVKLTPNVEENATGNFAYWNGNAWVVEGTGTLEVYDVLGRLVKRADVNSQLSIVNSQFPSTGVYVLRMGEKNQKIVVK